MYVETNCVNGSRLRLDGPSALGLYLTQMSFAVSAEGVLWIILITLIMLYYGDGHCVNPSAGPSGRLPQLYWGTCTVRNSCNARL